MAQPGNWRMRDAEGSSSMTMDGYKPLSLTERRASVITCEDAESTSPTRSTLTVVTSNGRIAARPDKMLQPRPRGPPTPNMNTPSAEMDDDFVHHRPPTPVASPGPDHTQPDWSQAGDDEDLFLAQIRRYFKDRSGAERTRILGDLLNLCTSQQLSFVHQYVSPLLKKDPFTTLPSELCLRIISFIDDPKVMVRASQVSKRWRDLLNDDVTWKDLCVKHDYKRRQSLASRPDESPQVEQSSTFRPSPLPLVPVSNREGITPDASNTRLTRSFDYVGTNRFGRPILKGRHKSYFKQRYLVETAWRTGGHHTTRNITQEQGVVTSLHLTPNYIVVALDNAKIHVFNTDGSGMKILQGHVMGVWAMVPWGDTLVSGGCDRDVRVWNMALGEAVHTLHGHTSTVRCLKMSDSETAISGSRDTTLRVWDIKTGHCKNVLIGHQASVRCLEIKGDIVVSGSYDTTARVWSISEGRCLRTLTGHFSQIYAIAFDGKRIATGSLDTSVRIWDPNTGACQAILQGHTSLVGQLQMRGNTLVTGGSDGSVRVWSLEKMAPIHRLAAHDNSVTSLQFDDSRIVSGGSDGRVKVWDLKTGQLVRELSQPADAVWRVAFEEEKCVVMASRSNRTIMEVWSFSPPVDTHSNYEKSLSAEQTDILPERPHSAQFPFSTEHQQMLGIMPTNTPYGQDDIHMSDAGPSTAPPRGVGTFFNED